MPWMDLLFLVVLTFEVVSAMVLGLRPALLKFGFLITIFTISMPLAANLRTNWQPLLAPGYTAAIERNFVAAVSAGGEQVPLDIGPWQQVLASPVTGGLFIEAVVGLAILLTSYLVLAGAALLVLWFVGTGRPSMVGYCWWSGMTFGIGNGLLMVLALLVPMPVFSALERGTLLADSLSGSAFGYLLQLPMDWVVRIFAHAWY